jgi:hypothetical protein
MSQLEETDRTVPRPETQHATKKPYRKPEFRFEHVFETRALVCGKVSTTQHSCDLNRKNS